MSILPSKYIKSVLLLYSRCNPLVQDPITSHLDYHNCFPSGLSLCSLYAFPLMQPKQIYKVQIWWG